MVLLLLKRKYFKHVIEGDALLRTEMPTKKLWGQVKTTNEFSIVFIARNLSIILCVHQSNPYLRTLSHL